MGLRNPFFSTRTTARLSVPFFSVFSCISVSIYILFFFFGFEQEGNLMYCLGIMKGGEDIKVNIIGRKYSHY